jgi:hypothetical protein
MDPQMLIDTGSLTAIPAPHWFIQFFKTLGFTSARGTHEPVVCGDSGCDAVDGSGAASPGGVSPRG